MRASGSKRLTFHDTDGGCLPSQLRVDEGNRFLVDNVRELFVKLEIVDASSPS
ncbi:MAG: hypothetical protein ACC642_00330 [Pseudomonadales bacterium]